MVVQFGFATRRTVSSTQRWLAPAVTSGTCAVDLRMGAVLAAGGDRFFFGDGGLMWLAFERQDGGAHLMKIDPPDEAQPISAVRTGPVPAPFTVAADVLRSYLGTYATEGPVVTVAIGENGWLIIAPPGEEGIPLRPVSDTEFRADAAGFRVVFHPENARTDRLTMYRGARELHGTRTAP